MIKKVAFYSNILLLLTSVHHIYGAYVYNTPWRLHILLFSIPVMLFNIPVLKSILRGKIWIYLFWFVNILFTAGSVGFFEGGYNHLLKVVLYYSATSEEVMHRLFPPPVYEMPGNFLFELTGVLQAVLLIPLVYFSIKALGGKHKARPV